MPRSLPGKSVALASQFQSIGTLLRHFLVTEEKIDISWVANSGVDAIRLCAKKPPSVLITSPNFSDMTGADLVPTIRRDHPSVRILLFTGTLHRELVQGMMAMQIHGIVSARSPISALVTAVAVLKEGGCYFDPLSEPFLHAPKERNPHQLTNRERTVLRLVAEGFSTKEIADQLNIRFKTADKFRGHIMQKLNLHDAVKLTRYAILNGICPLN